MFLVFPSNFSRSNLIDKLASQIFGSGNFKTLWQENIGVDWLLYTANQLGKKLLADKILVHWL